MHTMSSSQTLLPRADEIDLGKALQYLWANKVFILLIALLTLTLGIFYAARRPPLYQADVLLQIEENQHNMNGMGGLSKKIDFVSASKSTAATHAALIQSRFILEPVINSLGLNIKTSPKQSMLKYLFLPMRDKNISISNFTVTTHHLNIPFRVQLDTANHIRLFDKKGGLILEGPVGQMLHNDTKGVTLEVATIAAPLKSEFWIEKQAMAPVTAGLLNRLKIKELGGKENTGILQISLQGHNPGRITDILNEIAKYTQQKDRKKKSREASKALNFLHQQLPLAKASLQKAETLLNQYRATSGKIDIKLQAQSLLTQLEELDKQLNSLRVNEVEMRQRYTPAHPFFISLMKQIKILEVKRGALEKQLKTLPASDQIAVNLMRDVEVKNTLYLILLNKIQELKFVKAGTISSVRILSHATIPDEPLSNHNRLIYGGSFLLGLTAAILFLFGRKLFSSNINDPHWVEEHLNLVNLAIIPYCKEQESSTKKFKKKQIPSLPLLAEVDSRNLSIESLRGLRTHLQSTLEHAENNIVSILGISPGIGKTFISSNLAWLLATAGKRVLLVDGDIRRGVIHNHFNLSPKPGLVDFLNEKATLGEILKKTNHPNLTILPRGSYGLDPSELLMRESFKETIQRLSENFDILVMDTAPILLVTDGVLIANLSATNYLVMGANIHQPADIVVVMKRLKQAGIELEGSIFNFFKAETKHYPHNRYNAYHYSD